MGKGNSYATHHPYHQAIHVITTEAVAGGGGFPPAPQYPGDMDVSGCFPHDPHGAAGDEYGYAVGGSEQAEDEDGERRKRKKGKDSSKKRR